MLRPGVGRGSPAFDCTRGLACSLCCHALSESRFIVPSISSVPLRDVWAASESCDLAFQFYLLGDEASSIERLHEAIALGASAIVVTVDANAPRKGALFRATAGATGVFPSPRLSWSRLAELKAMLPRGMPMYLKGVQTAEDALKAVAADVAGIIVSNHGGRVCGDSTPDGQTDFGRREAAPDKSIRA